MKIKYTHAAYNESLDVLVKWNDNFRMLTGDNADAVSSETVQELTDGKMPKGWKTVPV